MLGLAATHKDDFDMVTVIRHRLGYGQDLAAVHDAFVPKFINEESFFLAWHAALLLGTLKVP